MGEQERSFATAPQRHYLHYLTGSSMMSRDAPGFGDMTINLLHTDTYLFFLNKCFNLKNSSTFLLWRQ